MSWEQERVKEEKREHRRRLIWRAIFYSGLVGAILGTVFLVFNTIESNHADKWLERAKDAGKPAQVAEYLTEYRVKLYELDRVDGKYYELFRYPSSQMEIFIDVIDGLIGRAEALAAQTAEDTSYQMGLVNLEEDLDDIEPRAFSAWFAMGGFVWGVACAGGFLLITIRGFKALLDE